MKFSELQGNGPLKAALAGMVNSGRVPHAILLHEDDGGAGTSMALAFLQYLFCQDRHSGDSCGECPSCNKFSKLIHPDLHFIFPVNQGTSRDHLKAWRSLVLSKPGFTEADLSAALGIEGKSSLIAVAQAREILDTLSLSALEGGYRAVLVYLPEKMNQEAANRLLKMIEEPPALTQFVLITHAPEKVLVTIRSRCQTLRIAPSGQTGAAGEEQFGPLFASLMDSLLSGSLLDALEVGEQIAALPSREDARRFCIYGASRIRDIFVAQQGGSLGVEPTAQTARWARAVRKTFPHNALDRFTAALKLIERNVNIKIVSTDLVDRLMTNL